jgi:hypothetical protein
LNEAIELVVCDMAGTMVRAAGQVPQAFTSALPASRRQATTAARAAVRVTAAEL